MNNWVTLADNRGVIPKLPPMKDASFQPDVLSKLELDMLNQECDMHQALVEE